MTESLPISPGLRSAQQAAVPEPAAAANHALSPAERFATRPHTQSPIKGLAARANAPRTPVHQSPAYPHFEIVPEHTGSRN